MSAAAAAMSATAKSASSVTACNTSAVESNASTPVKSAARESTVKSYTAMVATITAVPSMPPTPTAATPSPTPAASIQRPIAVITIIRIGVVIGVSVIIIWITRAYNSHFRCWRRWLGHHGAVWRRSALLRRWRLLLILLHGHGLLLKLPVALQHDGRYLLRQAQSPQIDDAIGRKMIRQWRAVDKIDNNILAHARLIQLDHLARA